MCFEFNLLKTSIKPLDFAAYLAGIVFTSVSESVRLNILALFASVALRNSSVLDGGTGMVWVASGGPAGR